MASNPRNFQQPIDASRALHRRSLRDELVLALLPTLTVIAALAFVNMLRHEQLLFASLSVSAFLIYLDPLHTMNRVRTLLLAQLMGGTIGLLFYLLLGGSFLSAGLAMALTIFLMIALDVVHPPAIATSLAFALRAGNESSLVIFAFVVLITAMLIVLQRIAIRLLNWFERRG